MATITSIATGNWSATATWDTGTVPTSADDVVIDSGDTVTIDAIGCEALSITFTGGILQTSQVASTDVTVGGIFSVANGTHICDLTSDVSITHTIYLNKNNINSVLPYRAYDDSSVSIKGFPRKRFTNTSTALIAGISESCTVDDATGWQIGDKIIFATTSDYSSTPAIDIIVLTGVSGNDILWTGAVTYDHNIGCYAGNFTSNVTIRPETYGNHATIYVNSGSTVNVSLKAFQNVMFDSLFSDASNSRSAFVFWPVQAYYDVNVSILDCIFFEFAGSALKNYSYYYPQYSKEIKRCVFYASIYNTYDYPVIDIHHLACDISDLVFFRHNKIYAGIFASSVAGANYNNLVLTSVRSYALQITAKHTFINNSKFIGNNIDIHPDNSDLTLTDCEFNNSSYLLNISSDTYGKCTLKNCIQHTENIGNLINANDSTLYNFINIDKAVEKQEIHAPAAKTIRENTLIKRSSSCFAIEPTKLATDCQREQEILCANGATIRIVGYIEVDATFYNSGTWEAPTVTLAGLGDVDVVHTATASANGAWEQYDISITNNSGNDGNFTLTFNANASAVLGGKVYFDGVPDAPFITKCRHYGFIIDESNPVRKVDSLIDVIESTAIAYTGATINDTTKKVSFATGTIDTYQKLYDYTMAFVCENLDIEIPYTRAGALFSVTTGWTIVEPTLDNTWDGGTIQWDTPANKSGSFSSNVFDFTATGTFDFGSATFDGTVELVNTSGGAVTVALPTGTAYTNTGPNITVTTPTNYVTIEVNALDALTGSLVPNTTVLIEAGTGGDLTEGTDIIKEITTTGAISKTDFVYTNDQPVTGKVRQGKVSPYYDATRVSGTITANGLVLNAFMVEES